MVFIGTIPSPTGVLTLSSNGTSITGLWIEGQKYFGSTLDRGILEDYGHGGIKAGAGSSCRKPYGDMEELDVFREARAWLEEYFSGREPAFMPSLEPSGSDFSCRVWNILCRIPYGSTMTYGAIAKEMALGMGKASMSAQAVGGAVGHNPISIMIPCHRVVGSGGRLTGYAAGLEVKKLLLGLEHSGHPASGAGTLGDPWKKA